MLGATGATARGEAPQKQDRAAAPSAATNTSARSTFSGQHGGTAQHHPPRSNNIELVSKLELTAKFGDVVPGQIADVAVYKDAAYLNSWATACERGGTFVVDISDPANPKETAHIPAPPGSYHGEGAHAITIDTDLFKGDVLAVNNEPCDGGPGGFDLIDVTDPANPVILVAGFGDTGPDDGSLVGTEVPNSNHSIFMWQHGGKAYAVTVDNTEWHDVDIFDISNPRAPLPVAEHDLIDRFDLIDAATTDNTYLHHDSVVKIINGTPILLTSYWDAGYVTMDVTDPADPVYIGDSTFAGMDPLTGLVPQEGNAHYGEFSHDNKYILAADEDFSAYRPGSFAIATGPDAGEYPATSPSGSTGVAILPDRKLNGPVVWGGYGCPAGGGDQPGAPAMPVPQRDQFDLDLASGEEAILVLSRGPSNHPDYPETDDAEPGPYAPGGCYPGEKVGMAQEAGWDAVVLVNRHTGDLDEAYCGAGAYEDTTTIPSLCTSHRAFHLMFGDEPSMEDDYSSEPEIGTVGERVESTAVFDSWGYAHLFENTAGKLTEVDAYAVDEALDARFAFGFGDLSIHEWATDPTEYLAYASYYSAGVRVATFGPDGIEETGAFIDEGGSNFWGIEQFTTDSGERLLAASDRDYGLYILRYTGPGAAQPPACQDVAATTEVGKAIRIPLTCTDANGNPLTLSIATGPQHGTLSAIADGAVTYVPKAGYEGADQFTYVASDGAATSAPATVRISVVRVPVPPLPGACGFRIVGTPAGEIINGTAAADTILGGAGDDEITGLQGDDCLAGEAGDDSIIGGSGDDRIDGNDGKDRLFGDSGDDEIRGHDDVDHIRGGSGDDRLRGDAGNDYLSGGSNDDSLVGGPGRDSLRGAAGNDRIRGDAGNDAIHGGKGRNVLAGGAGKDRINAVNGQRDRVTCGKGRDKVRADRVDRVGGSCERVLRMRVTRR